MNSVVVTGVGIWTAAGKGIAANRAALEAGRSGLGELTLFDSPRCGHLPVAQVTDLEDKPRTVALGREALREALEHAGLTAEFPRLGLTPDTLRVGLALGTCVGGMPETETAVGQMFEGEKFDEGVWNRHECGFVSHALATEFALTGPVTTVSAACSSSAQAIAHGVDLLEVGAADVMIAGGADALCRLTLNGFASLLNVSAQGCRPFDAERDGMSLGEGAAFLVLERAEAAAGRGATPLAVLAGHGNSCDSHHATAPHPDGLGAEAAMRAALRSAGLPASAVDYVNSHGTGTVENDRAEGRALRRLFGSDVPPVSSTKRIFGHTLGAAGAVEAVASILALRAGFLPGDPGLRTADPACEIQPLRHAVRRSARIVLSNSFGFGGNNSSLCIAVEPTQT